MKTGSRTGGFSLAEVLVVIAIISVLATIAVPTFQDFQIRVKTSILKANLATLHKAEKIFHSEFGSYSTRLDAIGYSQNGIEHANLGFLTDFSPPAPAPQGTAGCLNTCMGGCPFVTWTCTDLAHVAFFDGGINFPDPTASQNTFNAQAHFHYEDDGVHGKYVSIQIDENKRIVEARGGW